MNVYTLPQLLCTQRTVYNILCLVHTHLLPPPPCTHAGNIARQEMMKSKLPNSVLRRIWALSDIDKDGQLDRDEFAVAMFLIDHKLSGNDIPETLPERLIPPSKRMDFRRDHYHSGGGDYGGQEPSASENSSGGDSYRREDPVSSYQGAGNAFIAIMIIIMCCTYTYCSLRAFIVFGFSESKRPQLDAVYTTPFSMSS